MSFTISDVKELAESWINEAIHGNDALMWANEFIQNEVGSTAWPEDTELYTAAMEGTWYALPSDFIRTVLITNDDGSECSGYSIRNSKIKFDYTDSYIMTYVAYPGRLTNLTTAISLSDIYKYPMAKFLVFKYLKTGDEADKYGQSYLLDLKNLRDEMQIDSQNEGFQVQERW